MTTRNCPHCGLPICTYAQQAPTGAAWESFLTAWLLRYRALPVPVGALMALAIEHGVDAKTRTQFGQQLGHLARAGGLNAPVQHSPSKGQKQPSKWRLQAQ